MSPYNAIDATGRYPFREGFLYPLPGAVVSVRFALVDMPTGFVLFGAVSAGIRVARLPAWLRGRP